MVTCMVVILATALVVVSSFPSSEVAEPHPKANKDETDSTQTLKTPDILYEWVTLEYEDPPSGSNEHGPLFQPKHCVLTGLKICNGNVAKKCEEIAPGEDIIFTSTPRWAYGVPYTLHKLVNAKLQAWPSKEAQKIGDCSKIQYVQSMEIDPDGVMWVIDAGHKYFTFSGPGPELFDRSIDPKTHEQTGRDGPDLSCPPKIVLIDIKDGTFIQSYVFPPDVVAYHASTPPFGTFLNDIVIDTVRQVAFISDLGGFESENGGIIVYSRNGNFGAGSSRRYHDRTTAGTMGYNITVNGHNYSSQLGGTAVDGIALSPDRKHLYYAKLGDPELYQVSTDALTDLSSDYTAWKANVKATVVYLGNQVGTPNGHGFGVPDGITAAENGMIFAGAYNHNALGTYRVDKKLVHVKSVQSEAVIPWIDTFGWDNKGYLWMTSNRLNHWFLGAATGNTMDFSGRTGTNFKILKTYVGTNSYICAQEGVSCQPKDFSDCTFSDWGLWGDCYRSGNAEDAGRQWRSRSVSCTRGGQTTESKDMEESFCVPLPLTCPRGKELEALASKYEPWGLYSDVWGEDGRYGLNPYPTPVTGVLVDRAEGCGVCYEGLVEYLSGCLVGGRLHEGMTMRSPHVNSPVADMAIQFKPRILHNTTCKKEGYLVPIGVPAFYYKFQINLFARFSQERWNLMYPSGDQRPASCDVHCWWEQHPECNAFLSWQPDASLREEYPNSSTRSTLSTPAAKNARAKAKFLEKARNEVMPTPTVEGAAVPVIGIGTGCTYSQWSLWGHCTRLNATTREGIQNRTRHVQCRGIRSTETEFSNCTKFPVACRTQKELEVLAERYEPWGQYSDQWGLYEGRWGFNPYPVKVEGVLVDSAENCGVCYESTIEFLQGCLVGERSSIINGKPNWPYKNSPVVDMAIQDKPTIMRNVTCKELGYPIPIGNPAFYYKFQLNLFGRLSLDEWALMYPAGDQRVIADPVQDWWDNVPECRRYFRAVPMGPRYVQP